MSVWILSNEQQSIPPPGTASACCIRLSGAADWLGVPDLSVTQVLDTIRTGSDLLSSHNMSLENPEIHTGIKLGCSEWRSGSVQGP